VQRSQRESLVHQGLDPLHRLGGADLFEVEQVSVRIDQPREHRIGAQVYHACAGRPLDLLADLRDGAAPHEDLACGEEGARFAVEQAARADDGGGRVARRLRPERKGAAGGESDGCECALHGVPGV
jgi:hypothetical protein